MIPETAWCLQECDSKGPDSDTKQGHLIPVAPTLQAGGNGTGGDRPPGTTVDTCDSLIPVAHSLRAEGFDASEDGTGRGTPIVPVQHPVAFAENSRAELRLCGGDGQVSAQLTTGGGKPGQGQPCIAFTAKDHGGDAVEGISPTLRAGGHTGSHANAGVMPAVAFQEPFTIMERGRNGECNLESRQDGTANAILTPNGGRGGLGVGAIAAAWGVRRLTPREAERLMGFPDDYTLIPWGKKGPEDCPDGPRYRALGNSFAVNVITWIGERLQAVMEAADE